MTRFFAASSMGRAAKGQSMGNGAQAYLVTVAWWEASGGGQWFSS